jgi:glyceraldehyde 3-phosphate dehydrogenase (phosphorylating)
MGAAPYGCSGPQTSTWTRRPTTKGTNEREHLWSRGLARRRRRTACSGVDQLAVMTRVAINGFGRVGRNFLRAYLERRPDYEIVAVNDLGDPRTMAHLLEFDSVLGRLPEEVAADAETITVGEHRLRAFSIPEPESLPWRELGVDVVIESTGRFTKRQKAQAHLDAGARTVVISAVASDADVMLVLGVNDDAYDPGRHRIVSNASCTTNCVTPLAKVLHDAFGIERGFMTTVHAYTASQPILDAPHRDLRRARAAAINLIPTTTGATRALGTVLPALEGKIGAIAIRAPIPVGSIVDLVVEVARPAGRDDVNAVFREAAEQGPLVGILRYADEPLVSSDIVRSPYSCVFDSQLTMSEGGLVKVFGWYDNEWGYSCRLVDLVARLVVGGETTTAPRVVEAVVGASSGKAD